MIRLGEPIFRSIQGEGDLTGRLSIWVRFGGCNLRCPGFFQKDPTDSSTWIKPLELNPKEYKLLNELPVIPVGCDSLYSIDPRFKHLWLTYPSAKELSKDITALLYNGQWEHPVTKNKIDLCFTGGEPMLNQKSMVEILAELMFLDPTMSTKIQIETNGTKVIRSQKTNTLRVAESIVPVFADYIVANNIDLHFNISPKLYHVSGEEEAVNYEVIKQYYDLTKDGILKFVVNNDDRAWKELNNHVKILRDGGIGYPIYIMPVGATKEQQEDSKIISSIANRAINEGYNVSGRLHAILFGNGIGT